MGKLKSGVPVRHQLPEYSDEDGEDHIDCTGASCRYCAAFLIADCVAIGCCPCAVVSMLALVLVKVPWAVSRKCVGLLKRRWRPCLRKRVRSEAGGTDRNGKRSIRERDDEGSKEYDLGIILGTKVGEDEKGGRRSSCCSTFDAEKMWAELYQIGQWGFGRLSFSGNLKDSHNAPADLLVK